MAKRGNPNPRAFTDKDLEKAVEAKRKTGRWNQHPPITDEILAEREARTSENKRAELERKQVDAGYSQLAPLPAELMLHTRDEVIDMLPNAIQALREGLRGDDGPSVRHKCMTLVLAYCFGKPTQTVDRKDDVTVKFMSGALDVIQGNAVSE